MSFNPSTIVIAIALFFFALIFAALILRLSVWLVRKVFGLDRHQPKMAESWPSETAPHPQPPMDSATPVDNPYSVGQSMPLPNVNPAMESPLPMPSFLRALGVIFMGFTANFAIQGIMDTLPAPQDNDAVLFEAIVRMVLRALAFIAVLRFQIPTTFRWALAVFITTFIVSVALGFVVAMTLALIG